MSRALAAQLAQAVNPERSAVADIEDRRLRRMITHLEDNLAEDLSLKPVTQPADDLVKNWVGFLPGFDSTHHMVTNHTVTSAGADTATAEADFTATHRIGDALWVLGGRYRYRLGRSAGGWIVTSMTMQALWETGDRAALIKQALERVTAKHEGK